MGHTKDEDLKAPSGAGSSPSGEPGGRSRPSVPRMPPGVWPQVSQTDMGRVVRRLRSASAYASEPEPRMRLVGKTG
ncbi:MAG: hypothetical protein ABW123_01070 [Cystobacter sp.]